jgi:ubiquinone/menaquinone biosynthesis C-methylase UbiE
VNTTEYHKETKGTQTLNISFGDLYIEVRNREKRILTDGQLLLLPDIEVSHPHYKEWQVRKRSSQRLITYLGRKKRPLRILEIGCGNGWLSAKLSAIANSEVIGLDINHLEISQAKRVFQIKNLEFILGSFNPEMFDGAKFDVILFAASIQYFQSLTSILHKALTCLAGKGEIHIIDTHFYMPHEIERAIRRTGDYYKIIGYPEMATCYFHHSINDLKQFKYKILVNPRTLFNRLRKKDPFYWVSISQ